MKALPTRRSALKAITLAAAGATVARLARARAADDRLRVAFIGVGGRGRHALQGLESEQFAAFADVDDNRAADGYRQHPSVPRYRDYRRMLERHSRELDAVVISTPDHQHCGMALAVLQLGKHVYLEKPLAPTILECRRIATAAAAAGTGVCTQFGTHGHSFAALRVLREWLDAGAVGRIGSVHLWTERLPTSQAVWRTSEPPGVAVPEGFDWDLWLGPRRDRPFNPEYAPSRWRNWWDFGSGALGDIAVHMFDTLAFALDLGLPTMAEAEVPAISSMTAPPWGRARWRFDTAGAACLPGLSVEFHHGTRDGRFFKPRAVPHLPASLIGETLSGMAFAGTEGTLFIPDMRASVQPRIFPEARERDFAAARPEPHLHRPKGNHYTEWAEAIRAGRPAGAPLTFGAHITEIVLQAALAQRTGVPVHRESDRLSSGGSPLAEHLLGPTGPRAGWL